MTLFFFPFSRFFSVGEAGGCRGGGVQPASNQMGSNRVHVLQVGPRKRTRCSGTRRDESIGNNLLFKEPVAFSVPTEDAGGQKG